MAGAEPLFSPVRTEDARAELGRPDDADWVGRPKRALSARRFSSELSRSLCVDQVLELAQKQRKPSANRLRFNAISSKASSFCIIHHSPASLSPLPSPSPLDPSRCSLASLSAPLAPLAHLRPSETRRDGRRCSGWTSRRGSQAQDRKSRLMLNVDSREPQTRTGSLTFPSTPSFASDNPDSTRPR